MGVDKENDVARVVACGYLCQNALNIFEQIYELLMGI
jgi:hypothetical protein